MPAGAVSHATIDVDGDGRPDTEWISLTPVLQFGVTTAYGATYAFPLSTASPAPREGFIAKLGNRVVAMVDDNRSAYVYFFVNCGWVQPKNPQNHPYLFDFRGYSGNGSGVGCSNGSLVGWQVKPTSTGYTVTQTVINLNADGSEASNGATSTVVANASSSDPRVTVAQEISCGTVTVANGGVTAGD